MRQPTTPQRDGQRAQPSSRINLKQRNNKSNKANRQHLDKAANNTSHTSWQTRTWTGSMPPSPSQSGSPRLMTGWLVAHPARPSREAHPVTTLFFTNCGGHQLQKSHSPAAKTHTNTTITPRKQSKANQIKIHTSTKQAAHTTTSRFTQQQAHNTWHNASQH